jgi:hypothetical protein
VGFSLVFVFVLVLGYAAVAELAICRFLGIIWLYFVE